jgi:hypothetical protein
MLAIKIVDDIIKIQIGDNMNVKLFRLTSGEEIMSRFEVKETTTILKDAAALIPMGQGKLGLYPWLPYANSKNGVEVPNTYIAFSVEPVEELKQQYDAGLNKGIVTPPKSIEAPTGLKLTT